VLLTQATVVSEPIRLFNPTGLLAILISAGQGWFFTAIQEAFSMSGFEAKVFKPGEVSEGNSSGMPEEFREAQRKRFNRRLADHAGLKNFGVNLIRVIPGGQSSARHAHTINQYISR
jgi:hypothetical protein